MSIESVRQEIDKLDVEIVRLLGQRQELVRRASTFKDNETAVRAPDRVERVIGRVRECAVELGVDAAVVESTYRAMIAAFIDYELARHRASSGELVDGSSD